MKFFLMRHGHAESNLHDSKRHLMPEGKKEAHRAGECLVKIGEIPDIVIHSPYTRSKETAQIAVQTLKTVKPDIIVRQHSGFEPEDDPHEFKRTFLNEAVLQDQNILLVGHEPFLSVFASLLLTKSGAVLSLPFNYGTLLGIEGLGKAAQEKIWRLRFYFTAEDLGKLIWIP